jgi:hypothetical protein
LQSSVFSWQLSEMRLTGKAGTPCMEIIPRSPLGSTQHQPEPPPRSQPSDLRLSPKTADRKLKTVFRVDWTTWWLWRGACTRSHPELGRENPQRPWYCVSRHGRVGRRQVFQSTLFPSTPTLDFASLGRGLSRGAGWSSPVARQAHNLKAAGSNPAPATTSYVTRSTSARKECESFEAPCPIKVA